MYILAPGIKGNEFASGLYPTGPPPRAGTPHLAYAFSTPIRNAVGSEMDKVSTRIYRESHCSGARRHRLRLSWLFSWSSLSGAHSFDRANRWWPAWSAVLIPLPKEVPHPADQSREIGRAVVTKAEADPCTIRSLAP